MSKSLWAVAVMGSLTLLLLVAGMVLSLDQFTVSSPAVKWVKLAEQITHDFKLDTTAAEVRIGLPTSSLRVAYVTHEDSKFDLSAQNAEMEKIARFAIGKYEGSDRRKIDEVQVTRSEIHGRGCFQQTYVAHFTLANPFRMGAGAATVFPESGK